MKKQGNRRQKLRGGKSFPKNSQTFFALAAGLPAVQNWENVKTV